MKLRTSSRFVTVNTHRCHTSVLFLSPHPLSVYDMCVEQEETLALRKEGIGVILDSELPHLIGIDDDLLSTGIILYHLKVTDVTALLFIKVFISL